MTTSTGRPRKRLRSGIREHEATSERTPEWGPALDGLLERLAGIRSQTVTHRDDITGKSAAITENMAAAAAAAKAAARVSRRLPSEDVDIFSRGVRVDSERDQPDVPKVPPLPAMKLLMEPDPPEKLIHEQSIIVRAQAINRKNAELARERLPKQPEAQRNKTFHDYFLDEALWMASDFREERKWKIQMAKKVSKMVMQYHAQRAQREARAVTEARNKLIKVANSIARDVRKFWSQIAEIADYRSSLIEEAKMARRRASRLHSLLDKTAQFSRVLAKSLTSRKERARPSARQVTFRDTGSGSKSEPSANGPATLSRSGPRVGKVGSPGLPSESKDTEDVSGEYIVGDQVEVDDESTMIAAEADEEGDANELQNLKGEASMNVEELLRSQGIDPTAYRADPRNYLNSDDGSSPAPSADLENECDEATDDFSEASSALDDESTIKAAEDEEPDDKAEVGNLQAEAELGIAEILTRQGIDPSVYFADQKKYLQSDDEEPVAENGALESEREEPRSISKATAVQHREDTGAPRRITDAGKTMSPSVQQMDDDAGSTAPAEGLHTKEAVKGLDVVAKLHDVLPLSSARMDRDEPLTQSSFQVPNVLLRGKLRDYQNAGVSWLISLYSQGLNGILADEMGLGKTIQAISLLAWLAVEKGVWGPHLIVVPTSVMVNWEVEFKKWLPGFKVLTYFGSLKERKQKRQGWTRPSAFHVCITSYNLAVQDSAILRRKKWVYLILDEAHNIKNFQSQRWQTLLNFSSQRRLLITGTPLQNSVMELWSLMHFLMPSLFESHSEFKDWFSKPLAGGNLSDDIVAKLHEVLRPFLLRRLKADVEKGLPPKHEHVVRCPLSKRQRQLYEDFMSRSDVRDTLQGGDFFGVMNVLMQLRKVCNHPDLFEGRQILSPFSMQPIFYPVPTLITRVFEKPTEKSINLDLLGLDLCSLEETWPGRWHSREALKLSAHRGMRDELVKLHNAHTEQAEKNERLSTAHAAASSRANSFRRSQLRYFAQRTAMSIRRQALFGADLRSACAMTPSSLVGALRMSSSSFAQFLPSSLATRFVRTIEDVATEAVPMAERFVCCITKASAPIVEFRFRGDDGMYFKLQDISLSFNCLTRPLQTLFRSSEVRSKVTIPDRRLVQWDCGKLQVLDRLLRRLRVRGSRVLIFTQMTKVLDVLESFLNLHSLRYVRLDGTTKTDDRQKVVERFNQDFRIFCMILTTRAGGVGLNLTGADTVVFYDTDYNPAIDNQAQDRAHRIGQTKPVHIYRLVSEQTVEENILRRANEKRVLESMVISDAGFTTESIGAQNGISGSPTVPDGDNVQAKAGRSSDGGPRNGFTGTPKTAPAGSKPASQGVASRQPGQLPMSMSQSLSSAIEAAYGQYNGPADAVVGNANKSRDHDDRKRASVLQYQDVTSKLLAAEDDREKIAACTAEEEQRELRAEFDESIPNTVVDVSDGYPKAHSRDGEELTYNEMESSLTPVQRYALRLVERWRAELMATPREKEPVKWGAELTVSGMLSSRKQSHEVLSTMEGLTVAMEYQDAKTAASEGESSEEEDPLFYDITATENGKKSYLKALTDTDADIKLYLPLRDGGPEELKVSSVVSGTAAAGLECAEDAAFFPHAYNRMSRTIYSTHRQKEKARANLRKRRAEKEARRKKEIELAAQAAQRQREATSSAPAQPGRQTAAPDRAKGTKNKADPSRGIGGPASKKHRMDGNVKAKNSSGPGGSAFLSEGILASNTGLFKKSTKKSNRRLTLSVGKAGAGSGGATPGEGIGKNEGWTRNEDEKVISAASEWGNNMKLVADVISLDVSVPAGIRRRRGDKHCLERLVNSLQKDVKSGPPLPRATTTDADIFRKHSDALVVAANTVSKRPPGWMSLAAIPTQWHMSQTKVTNEASSKPGRIRSVVPPTFSAVVKSLQAPAHFRVGFKTTETTPQALNRKRFPFLRPPREDQRPSSQRPGSGPQRAGSASRSQRAGHPSQSTPSQRAGTSTHRAGQGYTRGNDGRQGGGQGAVGHASGSTSLGKATPKQGKASSTGAAARMAAGTVRSASNSRGPVPLKRPSDVGGGASRPPQVQGALPKVVPRKGVFVPGTSARMSICQVGGSVPNIGKPPQVHRMPGPDTKSEALRNSVLGKVAMSPVQLKSGKIGGSNNRSAVAASTGNSGSNGLMKPVIEKPPVRNGGVGESRSVPGRAPDTQAMNTKGSMESVAKIATNAAKQGKKNEGTSVNRAPETYSATGGAVNKDGRKDAV